MRLYYGTYGHRLSGKLYVYWGDDNLRTGQQVVAPVTNKRSGKTYDTMFTIARAQNLNNAQGEVERLTENGIFIKTIGGRDTLALPGGAEFSSKAEWKRDSDRRYRERWAIKMPAKASTTPVRAKANNATQSPIKPQAEASAPPKRIQNVTPKKKKKTKRKKSKRARKREYLAAKKLAKNTLGTVSKALDKAAKDDKAMEAARASLSKSKTAADSMKQRERLKEMSGRKAFRDEE